MVRWTTALILIGCWLHATAAAKADYIPWTYDGFSAAGWGPASSVPPGAPPDGYYLDRAVYGNNRNTTAGVGFSDPSVLPYHGTGAAALTVAALHTSTDPRPDKNHFEGTSRYRLALHLTDDTSGTHGEFVFFSTISNIGPQIFNSLTSPPAQSLQLGNNLYTVTFGSADIPSFGETRAGSLSASVDVQPVAAPEPSTLILAGLGASALVGAAWRRRRNARPSA